MTRPRTPARSKEQIAEDRAAILSAADGTLRYRGIARRVGRLVDDVYSDIRAMRRNGMIVPVRLSPVSMDGGGAVYRHYDDAGRLLYIGACGNPRKRLSSHVSQSKWFRQIVRVEIEWFDDGDAALAAELAAIRTENPVHNVRGREDLLRLEAAE